KQAEWMSGCPPEWIPETLGGILPFQVKVHFLPVMGLFILLLLTVFSGKIWGKNICSLQTSQTPCISFSPPCGGSCNMFKRTVVCVCVCVHVCHALRDTGSQLIITLSCLTKEDTGWYPCGIQWDFARDDLDFTELVVTDDRGGLASDFWSGKDLSGDRNRSCRASNVAHKANPSSLSAIPSGMSILIICILITGLGIISIICHLSKRRRSQRNRRGNPPPGVLAPKKMARPEQT
uniref:Transmembrane and immunoglobulin domain containing 3 n=1 Tax=Panthera tigris altaica TaxID=74533 RepID=A0A8C9KP07_PANTA